MRRILQMIPLAFAAIMVCLAVSSHAALTTTFPESPTRGADVFRSAFSHAFSSEEQFHYVTPDELLALMQSRADFVLVDTRPEESYQSEHIEGAVNLPWAMEIMDPWKLPRNKLLVVYCDCSGEETSKDLARQLTENFGYDNNSIVILEGGLWKWKEAGYPME